MHRREFDLLVPLNHVDVSVRPAQRAELPRVFEMATQKIPALSAALPFVDGVFERNADSILVYCKGNEIVGVYTMLLLSASGLERLLLAELDTSAPDVDAIVEAGEKPAAIYNWAVVAPKLASEGLRHTSVYLRQPLYCRANIYARGTTKAARHIMEQGGYQRLSGTQSDLYRYVRMANRQVPLSIAA